jgi:uncharacterized protein (TIGR02246 family)
MPARTPEDCDRLFGEYMNAADVDRVAALYEAEATLVLEGGTAAVGAAAIREALATFATMRPRLRMHVVKVVQAGPDLAVLYNDWTLTAVQPDGSPLEDAGGAIEVVRRQPDGTWRFAVDDPRARRCTGARGLAFLDSFS